MTSDGYTVADIMNTNLIHCSSDDTLQDACKIMAERAISSLFVGEQDKLISKDKIVEAIGNGIDPKTPIKDADVYRSICACSPQTSAREALDLIVKSKARRLIVVDNDKLVGVVSLKDFVFFAPTMIDMAEYRVMMEKTRFGEGETYRVLSK